MKVWQKGNLRLDKRIEAFTVGSDPQLDQRLVKQDCLASVAHAKMLSTVGILTPPEFKKLRKELLQIIKLNEKGKFVIAVADEDVHSKVENTLTAKLGALGKKLHTGRSRNDQVLVDLRLYTKEQLLATEEAVLELCGALVALAKKNEFAPMPGYTHMQRAMPSSVGLWAGAFAEALLDDLQLLKAAYALSDQCPLGSAAGYGASIKLNRALAAKLLGFKKVQNNNLYVQNSRGKIEAAVLFALCEAMLSLNKLATDMMLFSTKEFGFVSLPQEFCTGSSIMPQKQNPDVLELVRGKSSAMLSHLNQTIGIISNLPSGYNR
ncbi:MAG: argininosuccinate lyase, partial [Candidatus Diapherotrites archaeon]|nr:argininosuccinate lyase [Candidatus Diapherotrites archaeon]